MLRLCLLFVAGAVPAQAVWNQTTAGGPPSRTETFMVSDGQRAILFGGLDGTIQTAYNDVWQYWLGVWTPQPATGLQPPARSRFAAAFDPVRQRMVVFGGDAQYAGGGALGDTWEWDQQAAAWTQVLPATQPSARIHARMAYDLINTRVLMFGGNFGGGAETWAWDGVDWLQLTPATVPPAREQAMLATNWTTGEILMFGGSTGAASGILGDTWCWGGADWTQVNTATVPGGGIRNGRMVYDQLRDRMVLFGGVRAIGGFSGSVWEFDGVDWTERMPTGATPAGRAGAGFCYVANEGRSYLFGGYNGGFFGDTWDYQTNAPAFVSELLVGCPSSVGVPTLTSAPLPWTGETVTWTIGNVPPQGLPLLLLGLSNTVWAAGPLPFALGPLGFPACDLLVSPDTSTFAPGPVSLAIPMDPTLAGLTLYSQAAVLEVVGAGFDLAMSGWRGLTIGVR